MSTLPFVKLKTGPLLMALSGTSMPDGAPWPAFLVEIHIAVLFASGTIEDHTARSLARHWNWSRSRAHRALQKGAGRIWDRSGTSLGQIGTAPPPKSLGNSDTEGKSLGQAWDTSRARVPSLREKREELESREEQQSNNGLEEQGDGPSAPPEAAPPKAPSLFPEASSSSPQKVKPKKASAHEQRTERALQAMRETRAALHEQVTGSKPRAWATPGTKATKALTRKVGRLVKEIQDEDLGDPVEAVQALARWCYLGPPRESGWLRERGDPLETSLGGQANDPTNRLRRVRQALAWTSRGEPGQDRPPERGRRDGPPSGGGGIQPRGGVELLWAELNQQQGQGGHDEHR